MRSHSPIRLHILGFANSKLLRDLDIWEEYLRRPKDLEGPWAAIEEGRRPRRCLGALRRNHIDIASGKEIWSPWNVAH